MANNDIGETELTFLRRLEQKAQESTRLARMLPYSDLNIKVVDGLISVREEINHRIIALLEQNNEGRIAAILTETQCDDEEEDEERERDAIYRHETRVR